MTNTCTEAELIEGLTSQDHRTLQYCYSQFAPLAIQWIKRNGGTQDEAKDIFQDAIIALYTNVRTGKFEQRNAKVSTYLLQICKYKWLDVLKSSRSRKVVSMTDQSREMVDDTNLDEDLEALDQQKRVHRAIQQLKAQCQEILKLFYWEKMSMDEIASKLNMQMKSVKNGKYRCMQQLKEQFKNMAHGSV